MASVIARACSFEPVFMNLELEGHGCQILFQELTTPTVQDVVN